MSVYLESPKILCIRDTVGDAPEDLPGEYSRRGIPRIMAERIKKPADWALSLCQNLS